MRATLTLTGFECGVALMVTVLFGETSIIVWLDQGFQNLMFLTVVEFGGVCRRTLSPGRNCLAFALLL